MRLKYHFYSQSKNYEWLDSRKGIRRQPKRKGSSRNKKKTTNPLPEESISEADDHLSNAYMSTPRLLEEVYWYSHPTLDMS